MKVKTRMTKKPMRRNKGSFGTRKKICRFCADKIKAIDYKDARLLESFIRERGKIVSSRISGNCAKHQRRIAEAIKQARFMSLVPYTRI
jgi:small subunit ribosomal protein S18